MLAIDHENSWVAYGNDPKEVAKTVKGRKQVSILGGLLCEPWCDDAISRAEQKTPRQTAPWRYNHLPCSIW